MLCIPRVIAPFVSRCWCRPLPKWWVAQGLLGDFVSGFITANQVFYKCIFVCVVELAFVVFVVRGVPVPME